MRSSQKQEIEGQAAEVERLKADRKVALDRLIGPGGVAEALRGEEE